MASVSADCPVCGLKDSLTFSEWTENGAPHGEGFWAMPMSDVWSECECELTDEQIMDASGKAWDAHNASVEAQYTNYAAEIEMLKELAAAEEMEW